MKTKSILSTNPVVFISELEEAINDGWKVCYDNLRAPALVGFATVVWLEKDEDDIEIVSKPVGRPKKV